jgi:hypothetical protein
VSFAYFICQLFCVKYALYFRPGVLPPTAHFYPEHTLTCAAVGWHSAAGGLLLVVLAQTLLVTGRQ